MLTRISFTRACSSHHHQRRFRTRTQIQFERATAVRLASPLVATSITIKIGNLWFADSIHSSVSESSNLILWSKIDTESSWILWDFTKYAQYCQDECARAIHQNLSGFWFQAPKKVFWDHVPIASHMCHLKIIKCFKTFARFHWIVGMLASVMHFRGCVSLSARSCIDNLNQTMYNSITTECAIIRCAFNPFSKLDIHFTIQIHETRYFLYWGVVEFVHKVDLALERTGSRKHSKKNLGLLSMRKHKLVPKCKTHSFLSISEPI
jgi:hypothetical protein